MSKIKLCKDCKHSTISFVEWIAALGCYAFARCKKGGTVDSGHLVTGGEPDLYYCVVTRDSKCKPEGLWWESKKGETK